MATNNKKPAATAKKNRPAASTPVKPPVKAAAKAKSTGMGLKGKAD